jgi:SAM-dependent methyltransferase
VAGRLLGHAADPGPDGRSSRRPCVVELGCGTATLLASLHHGARRLGVEADPVLLQLARRAPGVEVVEGDFRSPAWLTEAGVRPGDVDVVLAVRALYYPDSAKLPDVYAYLTRWLRPGGVLVNADRFQVEVATAAVDDRTALTAWSQWWDEARAHPALAAAFRERDHRPRFGPGNQLTALAAHVAML